MEGLALEDRTSQWVEIRKGRKEYRRKRNKKERGGRKGRRKEVRHD